MPVLSYACATEQRCQSITLGLFIATVAGHHKASSSTSVGTTIISCKIKVYRQHGVSLKTRHPFAVGSLPNNFSHSLVVHAFGSDVFSTPFAIRERTQPIIHIEFIHSPIAHTATQPELYKSGRPQNRRSRDIASINNILPLCECDRDEGDRMWVV